MARDLDELAFGALLLGGLILLTKERDGVAWGDGWHVPVPDFIASDGTRYPASVTQEFKPGHRGVDIMFRRRTAADRPDFPAGVVDAGGARQHVKFFAPMETPILAAKAGKVWSVQKIPNGWFVVLDHGKPWATAYFHLSRVNWGPHVRGLPVGGTQPTLVRAGEQIGVMGHAPNDAELLRHLHFEPWFKGGDSRSSQDPSTVMATWGRSTWQP